MQGQVALVYMPFGSVFQPSMALGQIQAQLTAAGVEAATHYFNFDLACRLGVADYEAIAMMRGHRAQLGEWLFAAEAWDEPVALSEAAFLAGGQRETAYLGPKRGKAAVGRLLRLRRDDVPALLDAWADRLLAVPDLAAVAFSCMFFQTVPALALARRLKRRRPALHVVFGGPCFHGVMGRELMAKTPWIDAVATGEADTIVVPLFRALAQGDDPGSLPGLLFRAADGAVRDGGEVAPVPVDVLEALPDPDYADYFAAAERSGLAAGDAFRERIRLPFETSRGCWWGQVQHCTFCGLNPLGMDYRSKSPARAHALIGNLRRKWGVRRLWAADNILPQGYYKSLLPALGADPMSRELELFFEIKTNVSRAQVEGLAAAGVKLVQPGVESLSTNVLKRIAKGVTALQNVHALKLLAQYGVLPGWNILIRVPGETAADYAEMAALVPKLEHLHPPYGLPRKVELHRFSPYHARQADYVERSWPQAWYRGIYPEQRFDIGRVAYYFDADWKDVLPDAAYRELALAVCRWVAAWRDLDTVPQLVAQDGGVVDTREGRRRTWTLERDEAAVLRAIDDPMPRAVLPERTGLAADRVARIAGELIASGLALEEGGKLLGLPLRPGAPEPPLGHRRSYFQQTGYALLSDRVVITDPALATVW